MPRRFIPKRAALDLRACRLLDRACGRPTAERIADPSVTGHVLFHKAIAHAICNGN